MIWEWLTSVLQCSRAARDQGAIRPVGDKRAETMELCPAIANHTRNYRGPGSRAIDEIAACRCHGVGAHVIQPLGPIETTEQVKFANLAMPMLLLQTQTHKNVTHSLHFNYYEE